MLRRKLLTPQEQPQSQCHSEKVRAHPLPAKVTSPERASLTRLSAQHVSPSVPTLTASGSSCCGLSQPLGLPLSLPSSYLTYFPLGGYFSVYLIKIFLLQPGCKLHVHED